MGIGYIPCLLELCPTTSLANTAASCSNAMPLMAGTEPNRPLFRVCARHGGDLGLPLLEELIRGFSRSPEKMERVRHLVEDLRRTEEGRDLLPDGFAALWDVFHEAAGWEAEA